jgi:glycosyltransferase involved in cell wall biosynthesis
MRITISVGGRFHAFYLAQQLLKRNFLDKLITSYPKFETVKYGIPKEKTNSVFIKEILERGWRTTPALLRNLYNPQYLIHEIFDRLASKKITKTDIFVGWASFSLHSLRKAKTLGAVTVLERGSSHILYQNKILKEEYEKFGAKVKPFDLPHPKIIEKELREYEETDYIAVPSSFAKRTFLEYGVSENKIIQEGRGVSLSSFKQIPKSDNKFRVIFAGGLSLRKGTPYLLQAFSELNIPNSELLLLGSLDEEIKPFFKKYRVRYEIRNQYENTKEGRIIYIGHIPQPELYKYYSQGSVFVMPSLEEGLAVVQLQAMACGLPVISTTNTGGEDVVRDGIDGFIISIKDINVMKEKLVYLYENPEICQQMGQSAKARVSQGFTWDNYGEKITAIYRNILN